MAKDSENKEAIKKILVAVDHSSRSGTAFEMAVMFAKITDANIHGIYVHEEHWGRLNPSATFINEFTGKSQHLEENPLEQQIEAIARQLEQRLKMISRRHKISHSWQNLRGRVIDEILKAAEDVDLITIGRRTGSLLSQKSLGSTAKAIIERAKKPVLVLAENRLTGKNVIAVYDTSDESHKGLRLALAFAEKNQNRLFVLSLLDKKDNEDGNMKLEQTIGKTKAKVNVATLTRRTMGDFVYFIRQQNPGLVVIPRNHRLLQNDGTEILLHHLKCAVLLMS